MSDTNTARERLLGYCLAATSNEVTCTKAEELADAYRDEVLTEAAGLLLAEVQSHRYCAEKLLATRTTTAPIQQED